MKLVLDAGMGHRAEWTIPAAELGTIVPTPSQTPATVEKQSLAVVPATPSATAITTEDLRITVENALDKKLRPNSVNPKQP